MATWAVGDVHGRHATLLALSGRLDFDPAADRLWLVGDLVNRGPGSLQVLRWARRQEAALGDRFACVLGNHDLHLLATAAGLRPPNDDLRPVLEATDGGELLAWLRRRPLVHFEDGRLLVHAGLWPHWTVDEAVTRARQVEQALRAGDGLLQKDGAAADLAGALYAFTSMRMVQENGEPCRHKGPPHDAPAGCLPWFAVSGSRWRGVEIVCGHWAALGLHLGADVCALDSGAAWDRELTALRLEDRLVVQQPNLDIAA